MLKRRTYNRKRKVFSEDDSDIEEEESSTKTKKTNRDSNNKNTNQAKENDQSKSDSEPDLDPMADLDVDAPPEYICPITMSIMKDPVIMPDGQTYEREAIQKALNVNPISPITREPMDMEDAKTNFALKSLIEKYVKDHMSEIKEEPTVIDPTNMFQETSQTDSLIPITNINEVKLETFSAVYSTDSMLITVKPQNIVGRLPVSIIAIIDTSGSMSEDATLPQMDSHDECSSISRLQLVQYSLKTIVSTLGSSDEITIITFNSSAHVRASGVKLDLNGKEKVDRMIDQMYPNGGTNLWDGINKGIDEVVKQQKKKQQDKMITSLLVFTDGQPNIHPPMGLIPTLKEKLSDIDVKFSISTFGYGYSIDANLLEEIAEIGNGIYGYCPDASMVGTIFINYVSNLISEISPLNVLTVNGEKFHLILYNGSTTNLMIPLKENDRPEQFQISLNSILTNQTFLINEIKKLNETDENSMMNFKDQKYRKSLIDVILNAKESLKCAELRNLVLNLFEQLRKENNRSQFMKYLMLDLYNDDEQHGDIERACRKENFKKWGKNYLFSMLRFHILEQCGNFRDMSLQLYGNENFVTFRKNGNKIFMNLPMPPASERNRNRNIKITRIQSSDSEDSESDESNNRPLNHFRGRCGRARGCRARGRYMNKRKNIRPSSPVENDDVRRNDTKLKQIQKLSDDEDESSSDDDRKIETNLKYKRKQTMRQIHSRKKRSKED
ncbi:hypothetical protein M9Y10_017653 [Tritrichomonas musculus]|uniref:U-box domain containing protein n=1 Tax=Tritrichomonas musculus TaxID=1915356 RepID=A0ABR2HUZ2_9EUKA